MGGRNITRNQARANALRKQQGDGITLSRHQRRTQASRPVRVPSSCVQLKVKAFVPPLRGD